MIHSIKELNKRPLWVFIFSLVIYASGLAGLEITRINCRFALMTSEISLYGTGIFPTLNGVYYTDYPVSVFYLMHLASLGGKYINMFTLALPTSVFAALTVTATYLIGEKAKRDLGFFAVIFLFFSYEFINIARSPGCDMAVAAAVSWMIYLLFSADHDNNWKYYLGVPFCMVLALVFRGPLGLILINAAMAGYFIAGLKWKKIIIAGVSSLIFDIFLLYMGYLLILKVGGEKLWETFYFDQISSRIGSDEGIFYYFADAAGSFAPAYAIGLAVFVYYIKSIFCIKKDERGAIKFLRMLFGWAVLELLLLSIPGTKHIRYASSAVPALALAAAWGFMNFCNDGYLAALKRLILKLCFLIPPVCTLTAMVLIVISYLYLGGGRKELVPLGLMVILLLLFLRRRYKTEKSLMIFGALFFALLVTQIIVPFEARYQSSKQFVNSSIPFITGKNVYFFRLGPDGDEHKFMVNLPREKRFRPRFIAGRIGDGYEERNMFDHCGGAEVIDSLGPESVFIARVDKLEPLAPDGDVKKLEEKFEILNRGRMAGDDCVLFRKKGL